jgi:glycosyltransferase involved in cell wall biosynthesis
MKIGIFLYDLSSGGAEKIMVGFINHLCKYTNDDVTVILSRNQGPYLSIIHPKAKIIILGKESAIGSIIPFYKFLLMNRLDVLYSTLTNANIISLIIGKILGIRVIIRVANTMKEYDKVKKSKSKELAIFLRKKIYSWCYKCVAISKVVKDDIIEYTSCSKSKIFVIYNPVIIIDSEETMHLEDDCFHIGLVTRLVPQKNITTVVQIMESLINSPHKVKFHFFGEGKDSALLAKVREDYGNQDILSHHGFNLSYYSHLKRMHMFIHIPLWEGLGNSVLEVYNSGIPMILSNVQSGFSELITQDLSNIHYFHPTDAVNEIVSLLNSYINKEVKLIPNRPKLDITEIETYRRYRSLAE